jgi:hypothetical protein
LELWITETLRDFTLKHKHIGAVSFPFQLTEMSTLFLNAVFTPSCLTSRQQA